MAVKLTRLRSIRLTYSNMEDLCAEARESGIVMASVMLRMIVQERLKHTNTLPNLVHYIGSKEPVGSKGPRINLRVAVNYEPALIEAVNTYAKGEFGTFVQAVLAERYSPDSPSVQTTTKQKPVLY